MGGFNASVGALGLRALMASARVPSGSGPDMAAEIRRYQYAYGALIQFIMGRMVPTNSGISEGGSHTVPFPRWPLGDIVTPIALQWHHLYALKCLCNVPIVWHSCGLFYGTVAFREVGPSRKYSLRCDGVWVE